MPTVHSNRVKWLADSKQARLSYLKMNKKRQNVLEEKMYYRANSLELWVTVTLLTKYNECAEVSLSGIGTR